jgi:O-antigen/teichoic acid export membrane protein
MQAASSGKSTKKDVLLAVIWNSGGLGFYLACKWSLTILVVRLSTGFDDAGYLALAISITNILYGFAAYGTRNYQVSDVKNEHSTATYLATRMFTVITAQLICLVFCILNYGFDKRSIVVIIYMLLISGEAFSDALQGIAQKHWRMDIVGTSFLMRGFALVSAFVTLYLISGLTAAVLGSAFLTLLVIYIYDVRKVNKLEILRFKSTRKDIFTLLKICFPLMIANLLIIMYVSFARIILDNSYNIEVLGKFNSTTVPAAVLLSISTFVFVPYINVLSLSFGNADYKRFVKQILSVCGVIIVFVMISIIVSETVGAFLLSILFGEELYPYAYLLTEALIATGLVSLLIFLVASFTIMRKFNVILVACVSGLLCCIFSAPVLIGMYGMSGANYMQIIGYSVALVILATAFIVFMRKVFKRSVSPR